MLARKLFWPTKKTIMVTQDIVEFGTHRKTISNQNQINFIAMDIEQVLKKSILFF